MTTNYQPYEPYNPYQPQSSQRLQDRVLGARQSNAAFERIQDRILARKTLAEQEEAQPITTFDNDRPEIPQAKLDELEAEEESKTHPALRALGTGLEFYDRNVDKPLVGITTGLGALALSPLSGANIALRKLTGSGVRDPNSTDLTTFSERYFANLGRNLGEAFEQKGDSVAGDALDIWQAIGEAYDETDLPKYTKGFVELVNPLDPLNLLPVLKFGKPIKNIALNSLKRHGRGVGAISKRAAQFARRVDVHADEIAPRVVNVDGLLDNNFDTVTMGGILNRMTFEEAEGIRQYAGALGGYFATLPLVSSVGRFLVPTWYMADEAGRVTLKHVQQRQVIDSTSAHLKDFFEVGREFDEAGNFTGNLLRARGDVGSGAILEIENNKLVANLNKDSLFYRTAIANNEQHKLSEVYLFENYLLDDKVREALSHAQLDYFNSARDQIEQFREMLKQHGAPKEMLEKLDHYLPRYIKNGDDLGLEQPDDVIDALSNPIKGGDLDPVFGKPRRGTLEGNLLEGIEYHDIATNVRIFGTAAMRYINATAWQQNIGRVADKNLYLETAHERTMFNLLTQSDDVMKAIDEQLLEAFDRFDESEIDGIIYRATKRLDELDEEFADTGKKAEFGKSTRSSRKILSDILNMDEDIPPVLFIADRMSGILDDGRLMGGLLPTATGQTILKFGTRRMQQIARDLVNLRKAETERIIKRDELLTKYGGKYTLDDDGLKVAVDDIGREISENRSIATKNNTQAKRLQKRLRDLEKVAKKAPNNLEDIQIMEQNLRLTPRMNRKKLVAERQRHFDYVKERNRFLNRQLRGKYSIGEAGIGEARIDLQKQIRDAKNARKTARQRSQNLRRERTNLRSVGYTNQGQRNAILRKYGYGKKETTTRSRTETTREDRFKGFKSAVFTFEGTPDIQRRRTPYTSEELLDARKATYIQKHGNLKGFDKNANIENYNPLNPEHARVINPRNLRKEFTTIRTQSFRPQGARITGEADIESVIVKKRRRTERIVRYSYDDKDVEMLAGDLRREYVAHAEGLLQPTRKPRSLKQAVETARVRVRDAESEKLYRQIQKRKGMSDARRKEMAAIKELQREARNLKKRKTGDVEANQRLAGDLLADASSRRNAIKQELLQENPNAKLGGLSWFRKSVLDQFDQDYIDTLGDDITTVGTGQFDNFNNLIKDLTKSLDSKRNMNLNSNPALVGLRKDIRDGWDVTAGRPISTKMVRLRAALKRVATSRKRLQEMRDPYGKRLQEMEQLSRKDIIEDPVLGKLYGFQDDRVPGMSYMQDYLRHVYLQRKTRDLVQGKLSAPDNHWTTLARVGASISSAMRVLMTAFDWGVFGIHSFLMIGSDPAAFAKGVRGSIRAIHNPTSYHNFVRIKSNTISEMIQNGWALDTASLQEFSAFAAKNEELAGGKGILGAIGDKFYQSAEDAAKNSKKYSFMKTAGSATRQTERVANKMVGRFQLFFNANRTYMGVHMWETMKDTWVKSGADLRQLSDFINKATGYYDSASAGIGIQQQAMERAFLFFAPRYTRASLALITDAFRGGMKGEVVRETIFAQLAILPIYYASVSLMLGQEPKLDPRPRNEGGDGAGFLTVEVGGRNIGFGSMYVALARLAGDLVINDMEDLTRVANVADYRKNPFTKFIMGRNAPTTQVISSLFHGETFIGEPIEGASGFARFAGGNMMPFWAETLMLGGGNMGSRMLGASTEFFGARQYPMSLSEQLAKAREEGAREMYGNGERSYPTWNELNLLQREKIENNPRYRIGELREKMGEQFASSRFDALNNAYWDIYNGANERRASRVGKGMENVDKGLWDTIRFKEELFDANRDVAIERQALESDEFADIHDLLRESFNKPDRVLPAEDVAYNQYMTEIVFNPALHLETGDYDFDLRAVMESRFIAEWGDEVFQYVKDVALERAASPQYGVPDMVREFYHGRRVYDFYWKASDAAVLQDASNPDHLRQRLNDYRIANETDKEIMWANDQELRDAYNRIERIRKLFREKDPGLDIFVHRWYGTDLVHSENKWANKNSKLAGYYRYESNIDFPYPRFNEILPREE